MQTFNRICELCAGFVAGAVIGYVIWELPDVFLMFADLLENAS